MDVVLHEADVRDLPPLCPVTGLPTALTRRAVAGRAPFGRRVRFDLPVAPGLLRSRQRFARGASAAAGAALVAAVPALAWDVPALRAVAVACGGAAAYLGGRVSRTGPRLRYDGGRVTFRGVHHNFAAVTARDALPT